MVMFRLFVFSDDLFWGYQTFLDVDAVHSTNEICEAAVLRLRDTLQHLHMDILIEQLLQKQFHIHSPSDDFDTLRQILHDDPNQTTYICGGGC